MKFKEILRSKETEYIMEAHDAISANIVEEIGFKGIWGSGLTISAVNGYRDVNEISFAELSANLNQITDSVKIPVLVDIDTGYGDFNNTQLCVKKLQKIGVQGVSIEDKIFPKKNSFLNNVNQELEEIERFQNKIRIIKDSTGDNFCAIARTEAFIANQGVEEALKRAEAYKEAGADAIFVHSKKNTIEEIELFMKYWKYDCPIVIAPTTYDNTQKETFERLGIGMVIWANYMLRAGILAMEKVGNEILRQKSAASVKEEICSMKELFGLQRMDEYYKMKEKYEV